MPIAITPDQLALQASIRDWAKRAGPVTTVRRLEPDPADPAGNTYLSDLAGLTYFLADMHAPGIDIRPLREITGRSMFNEIFLDDVFVPDDCMLGAPGDGWRVAMSTLAAERVAIGGGEDEAVRTLLAAHPDDAERTGFHVASGQAVALLAERVLGLPR